MKGPRESRPVEYLATYRYTYFEGLLSIPLIGGKALAMVFGAIAAGLLLAGLTLAWLSGDPATFRAGLPEAVVWLGVYVAAPLIGMTIFWPLADGWLHGSKRLTTAVRMNAAGFSVSVPGGCERWRWSDVARVAEKGRFLVLRAAGVTAAAIPTRALPGVSAEDIQRLRGSSPRHADEAGLDTDVATVVGPKVATLQGLSDPGSLVGVAQRVVREAPLSERARHLIPYLFPIFLGGIGLMIGAEEFLEGDSLGVLINAGMFVAPALVITGLIMLWRRFVTWPRHARRLAARSDDAVVVGENGAAMEAASFLGSTSRGAGYWSAVSYDRLRKAVETPTHFLLMPYDGEAVPIPRPRLDASQQSRLHTALRRNARAFRPATASSPPTRAS